MIPRPSSDLSKFQYQNTQEYPKDREPKGQQLWKEPVNGNLKQNQEKRWQTQMPTGATYMNKVGTLFIYTLEKVVSARNSDKPESSQGKDS